MLPLHTHLMTQRATASPQVFFCKYNDPSYVKLEKLEVMIKLASAANIDQVLMEFKEYASEVDVDFVRKVRGAIPEPMAGQDLELMSFQFQLRYQMCSWSSASTSPRWTSTLCARCGSPQTLPKHIQCLSFCFDCRCCSRSSRRC